MSKKTGAAIAAGSLPGRGKECLAIQCKRYNLNNPVGVEKARELFGVVESKSSRYTKGVLVTSSSYSSDCEKFMDGTNGRLHLINGLELLGMIEKHQVDW